MAESFSVGRLQAALGSATNELTIAAANLNFDFSLVKMEAPPEYRALGPVLSPRSKHNAESGPSHILANRLGALFEDVCPPTPNLVKAYGKRASEVSQAIAIDEAKKESSWIFSEFTGVDATSLWAAATSSKSALPIHLLACMLARMWPDGEATSLWVEIVAERRQEIASKFERGEPIKYSLSAAAAQQEITREQLASWDASARSWLRIADVAKSKMQKQLMLIIKNIEIPVNSEPSLYRSVLKAWVSALETVESLIQGSPHVVADGAVLVALSAWHLYPDLIVFGGHENKEVSLDDPLVKPGGSVSLGISDSRRREKSAGVYWSLSLAHHRFYGKPVSKTETLSTEQDRVTFEELQQIILGAVLGKWFVTEQKTSSTLKYLLVIISSINSDSVEIPSKLHWMGTLLNLIIQTLSDEADSDPMLALGRRRHPILLGHCDDLFRIGMITTGGESDGESTTEYDEEENDEQDESGGSQDGENEEFNIPEGSVVHAKGQQEDTAGQDSPESDDRYHDSIQGYTSDECFSDGQTTYYGDHLLALLCGFVSGDDIPLTGTSIIDPNHLAGDEQEQNDTPEAGLTPSNLSSADSVNAQGLPAAMADERVMKTDEDENSDEDSDEDSDEGSPASESFRRSKKPREKPTIPFIESGPVFGLTSLPTVLRLLKDSNGRINLLRLLAKNAEGLDETNCIIAYHESKKLHITTVFRSETPPDPMLASSQTPVDGSIGTHHSWVHDATNHISPSWEVVMEIGTDWIYDGTLVYRKRPWATYKYVYGDIDTAAVYAVVGNSAHMLSDFSSTEGLWCFYNDLFDEEKLARHVRVQSGPVIGALTLLSIASKVYSKLSREGATISCKLFKSPFKLEAVSDFYRYGRNDTSRFRSYQRDPLIDAAFKDDFSVSLIGYFETGRDVVKDNTELKDVIGLSVGDSLYIPSRVLEDPAPLQPAGQFTRLLGTINKPGFNILVSPQQPDCRDLSDVAWRRSNTPFQGETEDYFNKTSMHLTFTEWKRPLHGESSIGLRDTEVMLLEGVVQVRDAGDWVADINIMKALRSTTLSWATQEKLVSCNHGERPSGSEYHLTAIETWDQVIDCGDGSYVTRSHGNSHARLALTSVLVGHFPINSIKVVVCPTGPVCWLCLQSMYNTRKVFFIQ
ncbi:uncharacterized protein PG998_010153 [Apiospora kogelbergensis]|uniref:uncharacterized protein n=1 Tax=Apiospora kogelbergensis TaxID=1337665 RepID=UPI003131A10F